MGLSDEEWGFIESLPPRADDRIVLKGILYALNAGCRWVNMLAKYGSYEIVWGRVNGAGRAYGLGKEAYRRMRSAVERFAWLKGGFKRPAIRRERPTSTFLGPIRPA